MGLAKDEINVPIALGAFRDKIISVGSLTIYLYSTWAHPPLWAGVQTTVSTDVLIDYSNAMSCPDQRFLLQLYIQINRLDRNVQKRSKTMNAN